MASTEILFHDSHDEPWRPGFSTSLEGSEFIRGDKIIPSLNQKHILRRSSAILNCVKSNLGLHSFCNTVSSIIG